MSDPIHFVASLPPIQGAFKIDGGGNGVRIQLEVPGTDRRSAMRLADEYTNQVFMVTITPIEE